MYLNVAGDNLYQKIVRKLKLYSLRSIRINMVIKDIGKMSLFIPMPL